VTGSYWTSSGPSRVPPRGAQRRAICSSPATALWWSCVYQYSSGPELAEDLMQVGYVGLLKAINNFDPAFGRGLAGYARPCIIGEFKR
jgi:hypothetical protein